LLGLAQQPGLFARAGVRARVRDQVGDIERAAAFQLFGERGDRLFPQLVVWRGQVDQVGVVDDERPARHCCWFLLKIWIVSHPARSPWPNALCSPPEIDMWAPNFTAYPLSIPT
jgi:hypothetical protein